MKKSIFLNVITLSFTFFNFAQNKTIDSYVWQKIESSTNISRSQLSIDVVTNDNFNLYQLNLEFVRKQLSNVQNRFSKNPQGKEFSIPNEEGKLEKFNLYEDSNFDFELQQRFPEIRAYHGIGINDASAQLNMSIDARGVQIMVQRQNQKPYIIEPYSVDGKIYSAYTADAVTDNKPFSCYSKNSISATPKYNKNKKINSGALLNFRIALSCNGEYAKYFGANSSSDVAKVLAAFNASLTKVNAVFQRDFGIKLTLINSTTNVIFYNSETDPYDFEDDLNSALQTTLDKRLIGPNTTLSNNNKAYDVGHLLARNTIDKSFGNAGCIDCVCINSKNDTELPSKGKAISVSFTPVGQFFDLFLFPHELGHQFGANHTFSERFEEGSPANIEPSSGSTIMSYAGIMEYNVSPTADNYFHSISLQQVQNSMIEKMNTGGVCASTVLSTKIQAAPTVNAGNDFTIPIGTPFELKGIASSSSSTNLTYCWEQFDAIDINNPFIEINSTTSPFKNGGPNFRSFIPTTNPKRVFPSWSTILDNELTTSVESYVNVESLSMIDRILNFRLTVRDNGVNGGQTNFDDVKITVDKTKGPFIVTSQNDTNYSYLPGNTINVSWDVANTNLLPGGENVDIEFSYDNGVTWTNLLKSTSNDGNVMVKLPLGKTSLECRILVKASNHIFFNVSKKFAVGYNVMVEEKCAKFSNTIPSNIPDAEVYFEPISGSVVTFNGKEVIKNIEVKNISGEISKITLRTNLKHDSFEDLYVSLTDPTNVDIEKPADKISSLKNRFVLLDKDCKSTKGSSELLFSNNGIKTPTDCLSLTTSILPKSSFSTFKNINLNGMWKLLLYDTGYTSIGSISSAELEICTRKIITSVLENNEFVINDLKIVPIPNNGTFNVEFTPQSNNVKISINDFSGRLINSKVYKTNNLFNEEIQIRDASSGIYIVTIEDATRKESRKIIVK